MLILVFRRVFFAWTKNVLIALRVVGPRGQPVVDVLLCAGGGGALMGLV
jgi:hypothetical protein